MNSNKKSVMLKKLQSQKEKIELKIKKLTDQQEERSPLLPQAQTQRGERDTKPIKFEMNTQRAPQQHHYKSINVDKNSQIPKLPKQTSSRTLTSATGAKQAPSMKRTSSKRPNTSMQVLDQELATIKDSIKHEAAPKDRFKKKSEIAKKSSNIVLVKKVGGHKQKMAAISNDSLDDSQETSTWEDHKLNMVIREYKKKFAPISPATLARNAIERPWANPQPSKPAQKSKATKKANAQQSVPLTARQAAKNKDHPKDEMLTQRTYVTSLPLQLQKMKSGKKDNRTIDLEILSKHIPKPSKINKAQKSEFEDRPLQIARPHTSFALDFGSLGQPVTDRLEHKQTERAEHHATTHRSRSASPQGGQQQAVTGRKLSRYSGTKLTISNHVSPDQDQESLNIFGKYDLPRQIENIKPRSILKSRDNSPIQKDFSKQVVIQNEKQPKVPRDDQFLLTFSKKDPVIRYRANSNKKQSPIKNNEARHRSTSSKSKSSISHKESSSPQFKKVTDILRANGVVGSPISKPQSGSPRLSYNLRDARKNVKVQNNNRSKTPLRYRRSPDVSQHGKSAEASPSRAYVPIRSPNLIQIFTRSRSQQQSQHRKQLVPVSQFEPGRQTLERRESNQIRSKSAQPIRARSKSPDILSSKRVDRLVRENLKKQASLDKLKQDEKIRNINAKLYKQLEIENQNKMIRKQNESKRNKSSLRSERSTISPPPVSKRDESPFQKIKESRTYRLGMEIFAEGEGLIQKKKPTNDLKTDRSSKKLASKQQYQSQDKNRKKEKLSKLLKEQMERKITNMKKAQMNNEMQRQRVQLNLKKLEQNISNRLRSKSKGQATERQKSRPKSRPKSTMRDRKKAGGKSPGSNKSGGRSKSMKKINGRAMPKNDKIKQIIQNQQQIIQNSKNTSSLKNLALNLLSISEQNLVSARQEKVKGRRMQEAAKEKPAQSREKSKLSDRQVEIVGIYENQVDNNNKYGTELISPYVQPAEDEKLELSSNRPSIDQPYLNQSNEETEDQEILQIPSQDEEQVDILPLQIFGTENHKQFVKQEIKKVNYSSITMGNDKIQKYQSAEKLQVSPARPNQQQKVEKVLNYSATVIQRWFRQYLEDKRECRIRQNYFPEAEATSEILASFKQHRISPEKNFENFKSMIEEEIEQNHKLIEEIQNSDVKNQVKNSRLFETSQKSILVSIQKSRKHILSQVNSSHEGYGSSHGSKEMTRRRDVNQSEDSDNQYEAEYRLAPLPSPMIVEENNSQIIQIEDNKNPFQPVNSDKSGPIQKDGSGHLNFDYNQFEVESLHDFIHEGEEEIKADDDKVQYVSSLRSVEARNFVEEAMYYEQQEGSTQKRGEETVEHQEEPEEQSMEQSIEQSSSKADEQMNTKNSIEMSEGPNAGMFWNAQKPEVVESEGPSSKFLQASLNRLSHLQNVQFNNDPNHQDISQISFLNQAKQLLEHHEPLSAAIEKSSSSTKIDLRGALIVQPIEQPIQTERRKPQQTHFPETKNGQRAVVSSSSPPKQSKVISQSSTSQKLKLIQQASSLKSFDDDENQEFVENQQQPADPIFEQVGPEDVSEEEAEEEQNDEEAKSVMEMREEREPEQTLDSQARFQVQIEQHRKYFEAQMQKLGQELKTSQTDESKSYLKSMSPPQESYQQEESRFSEAYSKQEQAIQQSPPKQEAVSHPKEGRTSSPEVVNGRHSLSPEELAPRAQHNEHLQIKPEDQRINQQEIENAKQDKIAQQNNSIRTRIRSLNSSENGSFYQKYYQEFRQSPGAVRHHKGRESDPSSQQFYQNLEQFPIIKTPVSSSLKRQKSSQFGENEGSVDKISKLSKSGYKSERKEEPSERSAAKIQRDYGGMYNTQPLAIDRPGSLATKKINKAQFLKSINNQNKIDSLKNEKWPGELKTDAKDGQISKSQNKSVSSFYIETMQIISKVNEHVKLIKENLMTKSGDTDVKEEGKELSPEQAASGKVDALDEARPNDDVHDHRFTSSAAPQTTTIAPQLSNSKSDSNASSKNANSIKKTFEKESGKAEEEQDHILDISDIKLGLHTKETKSISIDKADENFDVLKDVADSLSQHQENKVNSNEFGSRNQSSNLFECNGNEHNTVQTGQSSADHKYERKQIIDDFGTSSGMSKSNEQETKEIIQEQEEQEAAASEKSKSSVIDSERQALTIHEMAMNVVDQIEEKLVRSLIDTEVETYAADICKAEEEMQKEEEKAIENENEKEEKEDAPCPEEKNKEESKTEEMEMLKNILGNKEEQSSPETDKPQEKSPQISPQNKQRIEVIPQQISLKQQQIQQELDELQKLQNEETKDDQLIAGIDTSLETVDSYIEDIFSQIRERGPQFLNAFLTPIYKDPIEQLQLLQRAQLEYQLNASNGLQIQNLLENFEPNSSLLCILNVQLYLTLEKEREAVIKEAIEQIKMQTEEEINEEELTEMISEADHIHNKAIFDSVNEAMNIARPYGAAGEPMPWSNQPRKNVYLMIEDNIESVTYNLEKILQSVKERVLKWASLCAGSISYSNHNSDLHNILRKEGVQEKDIEHIIRQELQQSDDKDWQGLNDNMMSQVKLELADKVTDLLMSEAVEVLNEIENKRKSQKESQV